MHLTRTLLLLGLIRASACAPQPLVSVTATAVLPTPTPASYAIDFTTPDGATIGGVLYGSGATAVIFSVMGNCRQGWDEMAELVGKNGMMALTYRWRGCKESGTVVEAEIRKFVDDLRGAIDFMRQQGAEKIILAGASLGGVASAKLAVESGADGLIVIASPPEISQWDFAIEPADLNTDIPKLFITAENDAVVTAAETRELFDLAAEPKEWQTYPGTAHGTELFDTESSQELEQRILSFIMAIASARQPM